MTLETSTGFGEADVAISAELYQVSGRTPEQLWEVVGDPWRLAEWTDAERVDSVEPQPVTVGTRITTSQDGGERVWRVITVEPRLLEMTAETNRGTLGVGIRVVRDPLGSRLIMAAQLAASGLRAQMVDGPALRRSLDRWCSAAVRVARATTG